MTGSSLDIDPLPLVKFAERQVRKYPGARVSVSVALPDDAGELTVTLGPELDA